jgi:hypothetical protein
MSTCDPNDLGFVGVHSPRSCAHQMACPVHDPSDHHMRGWPVIWRDDKGILERICPHGIGHPDPDQFEHWDSIGRSALSVHGCDGCCQGGKRWTPSSSVTTVDGDGGNET